ncbi:unnamed protein product [Closterium sp. NIES-53]
MLPHAAFPHHAAAIATPTSVLLVNPQGSRTHTPHCSPHFLPRRSACRTLSVFPASSASCSPFSYSCNPAFPLKLRRSKPLRRPPHGRTPHLPAPVRASTGGSSGEKSGRGTDAGGAGAEAGDGGARAGGVTADAAGNNGGDNGGFWATVSSAMQSMADVVTQAQRELLEGEYSAGTPWLDGAGGGGGRGGGKEWGNERWNRIMSGRGDTLGNAGAARAAGGGVKCGHASPLPLFPSSPLPLFPSSPLPLFPSSPLLLFPLVPPPVPPSLPLSPSPHLPISPSPHLPFSSSPHLPISPSPHLPISPPQVVEVSRRADNSLAGSRVLLLDQPGNIHSMHFKYKPWTGSYYDLFTLLPPLLPSSSGPIAILGLAAGTGARLLLRHYPHLELHGWEIDEHVIQVAHTYFDLEELEDGSFAAQQLRPYVPFSDSDTDSNEGDYMGEEEEKEHDHGTRAAAAAAAAVTVTGTATEADPSHADGIGRLVAHCGDALSSSATVPGGFAGIIVDLYSRGAVVAPLQREDTWRDLSGRLREGGKILVNCGGGCVEGDESVQGDGEAIMLATLEAMSAVFPPESILCHRVGDEDGEDDGSDDMDWDGNVMVIAGHDRMPWPLLPAVPAPAASSSASLPFLVPSPSSASSPASSSSHPGGVGGEKEREQAEGGGVARDWEEEWRARVPAELGGKVGQWMPLGRFMEAQRRRMRMKSTARLR